jgi:asparagine synthase (glutamine-hydrolysing)
MCGILGFSLREGNGPPESLLEAGLGTLGRRGPDGTGTFRKDRVFLGHTRLSIIDLSTGDQPMANEDGSLTIVFNGEIYNYVELREELLGRGHVFRTTSDTEVILHLYEDYGAACLGHLRGMFAFALWDDRQGVLFVARDRVGVKPLVYHEGGNGFFFASEIQALFSLHPELPKECDLAALDFYLTLQYIPSPMTGFLHLRKLPPAHYMVIRNGRVRRLERYWDIPYGSPCDLSFPDACERLRENVLEATRLRLRSDVPFGAFLSGGADSGIVVAAMSRILGVPVRTFTVGFGVRGYDEVDRAREVAQRFRTDHTEFRVEADVEEVLPEIVRALGEPFGDSSVVPTYYISKMTARHVKVALTGDGGDETFAGYRRFRQLLFLDRIERYGLGGIWKMLRRGGLFLEGIVNPKRGHVRFPHTREDTALDLRGIPRYLYFVCLFDESEKADLLTPLLRENRGDVAGYLRGKPSAEHGLARYLHIDQTTFLPEDVLFKVDICSMLNSLECRSPLLDHKLIEFAASLPGEYKLRGKEGKFILKDAFRDWFPPGFFRSPKVGFAAPTHVWLRGRLHRWCAEEMLSSAPLKRIVKAERMERLLSDVEANSKKIWSLLVLSQWFKVYGIAL